MPRTLAIVPIYMVLSQLQWWKHHNTIKYVSQWPAETFFLFPLPSFWESWKKERFFLRLKPRFTQQNRHLSNLTLFTNVLCFLEFYCTITTLFILMVKQVWREVENVALKLPVKLLIHFSSFLQNLKRISTWAFLDNFI